MDKIYFDRYKIADDEGCYVITNLNGNLLYKPGKGFKTKQRAVHFLQTVLTFLTNENKFKNLEKNGSTRD